MSSSIYINFLKNLTFQPFFIPILLLIVFLYKWYNTKVSITRKLPPSPPKLPVLGNLHQIGNFPHRSLSALSKRYGGLMSIRIGSIPALVVSSADAASDIFKTHDAIFANRPKSKVMCKIIYGGKDIVFSPYGEYWRQIRSICVLQLLSNKKVQSFRDVREEEVSLMVETVKKSVHSPFNLAEAFMTLSSSVLCRTAYGRKYDGENETNFGELLAEFVEVMAALSMGDFIPWLGWIDKVSGLEKMVEKVAKKFDDFLEKVLQEHMNCNDEKRKINGMDYKEEKNKDFVDILLDVQRENPDALPKDGIKAIILDMFAAGTDTTFTLLEWATTELLGHPEVMKKLQDEVRQVVKQKPMVDEDDLVELKYLKAVLKETLRLHPPLPVLLFRQASKDVKLQGYDIAANTQIIINAWAIQRDPAYWENPVEFRPERFLNSSVEFKVPVSDFNWIPFGGGRRGCPGINFAMVNAELALANLVYTFDWKVADGTECDVSKVRERPGITINRRDPLMVIPNLRACA
ncbi:cytochrome P450 736A117-like [Silene latifolia]|uniref:cytochrome P450 736A117-like n=1 Tax=Silene latifolia TaxID=37657 RepID=UPI003D77C235